jgi:hypothetical protein
MRNIEMMLAIVAMAAIGLGACPKPTDGSACGVQNSNATVANGCVATTGGYYVAAEKICDGDGATKACNPNPQTGTAKETTYATVTINGVQQCDTTQPIGKPKDLPYNCNAATSGSADCGGGGA